MNAAKINQNETIKYRGKSGVGFECTGKNATKLMQDSYKQGVKWTVIGTLVGTGVGLLGKWVYATTKPTFEMWGENIKAWLANRSQRTSDSNSNVVSGAQVITNSEPYRRWLIPGILREGDTCVIFAPEKTGKTTLAMNWACSINAGVCDRSLPSYEPVKIPVLYYNMELSDGLLTEFFGENENFHALNFVNKKAWKSTEEVLEHIKSKLDKIKGSCAIYVDNLTKCGLNSTDEASRSFHLSLDAIKEERLKKYGYHTTIVSITHTIKDAKSNKIETANMRGSSILSSLADVALGLYPAKNPNQVLLKVVNIRSAAKPEQCYLLERVSTYGNHHFEFIKMINENEELEQATSAPEQQRPIRDWEDVPEEERENLRNHWRTKNAAGTSYRKLEEWTIEEFSIHVSFATIGTEIKRTTIEECTHDEDKDEE